MTRINIRLNCRASQPHLNSTMLKYTQFNGSSLPSRWLMALPLALTLVGGGLATAAPKPSTTGTLPAAATKGVRNEYLLGPDDVLSISVSNHPDLNTEVAVGPDGTITLQRAGDITVTGKSARTLAREIQNRLAVSLNNARVQVVLKTPRPRQARIIGAVKIPGNYTLKTGAHLVDLLGQSGGLTTKPSRISGRVVRSGNVIPFDTAKAIDQPDSASNVALFPDDVVMLDAQDFSKQITVIGSVKTPGVYDMEEGLTVMSLLAQTGGPNTDASLRTSQVLRKGKPILTDLSGAVQGNLNPDSALARFTFQPGDTLLVSQNTSRFSVTGQVVKPAYYPVPEAQNDATVFKALSQAGGPLIDGDLSQVTLTRTTNGKTEVVPVDVSLIIAGKMPDTTVLQPDDILYVPKKKEKHVGVYGLVATPATYVLEDHMSLLDVLAKAGNPVAGAGLTRAYIQRDGKQITVNLRPALVDHVIDPQVADFQLQDNDSIYIPDNKDLVQVQGAVERPGSYSLDDDLTVNSLLTKAGDVNTVAARSKAYVQRKGEKIYLNLVPSETGTLDPGVANFRFIPGDVLFIPQNPLRFAVIGQVARPAVYSYPENPSDATVLSALTVAGGPIGGSSANLAQASIVRTINGQTQLIPVDLKQLLSGRKGTSQPNVQLLPKDVLFIPGKDQKPNVLQSVLPFAGLLAAL